jgi:hypothetical protein
LGVIINQIDREKADRYYGYGKYSAYGYGKKYSYSSGYSSKQGVIDLHCHLLPGIDDGPETLESALQLARHAVASGIRISVVTPHMHAGRYENRAASIRQAAADFQAVLDQERIALRIQAAAEVRLDHEILAGSARAGSISWPVARRAGDAAGTTP